MKNMENSTQHKTKDQIQKEQSDKYSNQSNPPPSNLDRNEEKGKMGNIAPNPTLMDKGESGELKKWKAGRNSKVF